MRRSCRAPAGPKQNFGEVVTELLDGIADGFYAVDAVAGTNDLTFVRFATNKGVFDPSKKGQRYVRHIVGGHGEMDNVGIDWIRKVAAAVPPPVSMPRPSSSVSTWSAAGSAAPS